MNGIFQEFSLIQTPEHQPHIFPIPNSFNLQALQFLLLKNLDLIHHFPITTSVVSMVTQWGQPPLGKRA